MAQDAVPLAQDAVPLAQDAVLMAQDAVLMAQDAVLMAQDAVLMAQDAVLMAQDAVPLVQDGGRMPTVPLLVGADYHLWQQHALLLEVAPSEDLERRINRWRRLPQARPAN